jgi:hypothetical protein
MFVLVVSEHVTFEIKTAITNNIAFEVQHFNIQSIHTNTNSEVLPFLL